MVLASSGSPEGRLGGFLGYFGGILGHLRHIGGHVSRPGGILEAIESHPGLLEDFIGDPAFLETAMWPRVGLELGQAFGP